MPALDAAGFPVLKWKVGQGSESRLARPAAEGEDTGRDGEGEARPLTHLERPKPQVMGADKEAKRPAGCTLDDRWRIAPLAGEGRGGVVRRVKRPVSLKTRSFFDSVRQIQRFKSCRLHQRPVELFFRLARPLGVP